MNRSYASESFVPGHRWLIDALAMGAMNVEYARDQTAAAPRKSSAPTPIVAVRRTAAAEIARVGSRGGARIAPANSRAVAKRSAGARDSARATAASMFDGTLSRRTLTLGAGPAMRFAITACAEEPVNGGSPASIS